MVMKFEIGDTVRIAAFCGDQLLTKRLKELYLNTVFEIETLQKSVKFAGAYNVIGKIVRPLDDTCKALDFDSVIIACNVYLSKEV